MTKARDIASAAPAPSTVSATELGYLDGVSSAVQTQLDAKTAKSTLTTTGDIYYASSANTPARLGIGSAGNVLTVASGIPSWTAPATPAGMPAVYAYQQYVQNPAPATATKINYEQELFDTNNNFANSRFTPTVSGYYLAYAKMPFDCSPTSNTATYYTLYKNGSGYATLWSFYPENTNSKTVQGSALVYMNGTTDYLEVYIYSGASSQATQVGAETNYFNVIGIRS